MPDRRGVRLVGWLLAANAFALLAAASLGGAGLGGAVHDAALDAAQRLVLFCRLG